MAQWFEQNAVDLIGYGITFLGIIVAAGVVVWQIGRQHKDSLALQRDNAREELKLRVHGLLVQRIRKLSDANVSAGMYAFMIPMTLETIQEQFARGLPPSSVRQRAIEFSRLHDEASQAVVELLWDFEAWSIAFPGLEVFRAALHSANHDAREAYFPLFNQLLIALPMDPPEDAPPEVPRPVGGLPLPLSGVEMARLKVLVDRYKWAMDDISNYVYDLTIESQNNLLSGLFEHRVPQRQPIDPRFRVISTDPVKTKELLYYFENETSWGKEKRETEARVRDDLDKP